MGYFNVYQINFTDAQVAVINAGSEELPFYREYLDTICFPKKAAILKAAYQYKLVAQIDVKVLPGDTTNDRLEQAFMISNMNVEKHIRRLDKMHSLSVGDVLFDNDEQKYYYVDFIGFKEIPEIIDGKYNFKF